MKSQLGALVVILGVVVIEGRVIGDEKLFGNYWDLPPYFYTDNFKKLSQQDEPYYADDVPMVLREVPDWPSAGAKIGQVGGIAVDSVGNVVVFHRADRRWETNSFNKQNIFDLTLGPIADDVILSLTQGSGDKIKSFGAGEYYMPHGLTIDADDNLWLTDVGRHQVYKIPQNSTTPSLTLGVNMEPGNDDTHFCKPTDVAVASNGDFFVADGYCNSRIMKFSADGTLLQQWGKPVTSYKSLEEDQFFIPHSLALDESRDQICVADRENYRIQCFSAGLNGSKAGTFINSFQPGEGPIYAIEYDPNADVMYAVNGPGYGNQVEGFTLDMDGTLLETWNREQQPFEQPHDVTVSRDGANVYVGDIGQTTGVYKMGRRADSPLYK